MILMIAIDPDPRHYQQQLDHKLQQLRQQFSRHDLPEINIFTSPALHFRHRADFAIWHDGDDCHYAVFPAGRDQAPRYLDSFPIASEKINQLMAQLMPAIKTAPVLKYKLFQVNFHTTLSDDAVLTLTYHKPLGDEWLRAAEKLRQQLSINIVGRGRKQKEVLGKDYVIETFSVGNRQLRYRQPEGCFTQSNATICRDMLNWVDDVLLNFSVAQRDLLELYCGNGNFTLAMARHFDKVLATELVKQLVRVAKENCADNQIDNIAIARLAAHEVVAALDKVRPFRRLQHVDLDSYQFSTLFVDPPRGGLDPTCHQLASGFEHVLYISCNPETLLRDLNQLQLSHKIDRMAVFDQFPYTHHLECGVSLIKR